MEEKTPLESPSIKAINKSVVRKILSGQVILDLSSAVKELVENSLDAGATRIEISLKNYGEESFQVSDNGSGISPKNFKVLALKHHTSKLENFVDLQSLCTFGFRGEALSSLCALGIMTVETRTENESWATHLTFDHLGLITGERKTARQIGTTVTVKNLFCNLPVRSKEFSRNIRKEYGKLISLLNAYAVVARGVRLICSNASGKSGKSVVLNTQGSTSLKDNIITVFGMNTFTSLEPVNLNISDNCEVEGFISRPGQGSGRSIGDRQFFFMNRRPVDMPKVSKLINELYKGANSRQYPIAILDFILPSKQCDINVTPDKRKIFFSDERSLLQSLREGLERIYSPNNVIISLDKRIQPDLGISSLNSPSNPSNLSQAMLKLLDVSCSEGPISNNDIEAKESTTVGAVSEGMLSMEEGKQQNNDGILLEKDFAHGVISLACNGVDVVSQRPIEVCSSIVPSTLYPARPTQKVSSEEKKSSPGSSRVQTLLTKFVSVNKRKHESIGPTLLSEVPILRKHSNLEENNSENHRKDSKFLVRNVQLKDSDMMLQDDHVEHLAVEKRLKSVDSRAGRITNTGIVEDVEIQEQKIDTVDASMPENFLSAVTSQTSGSMVVTPKSSGLGICSISNFSLKGLKMRRDSLSRSKARKSEYEKMKYKRCYAAATLGVSVDDEEHKSRSLVAATTELERFFKKDDFGRMMVIGQFNLGFIICKLDDDLFIVDQHAADEKYNFERLSRSTIMNLQPLLRPLDLELSPEEEVIVSMHMDTIRRNGFSLEEDLHASPAQRFKLKAVPFSKNITFGPEDLRDLISTLADGYDECSIIGSYRMDTTESVCPPRVWGMLASRACRSSVMIGDALSKNEMQKILEHLTGLRSPWNCPHGRPTMRHLIDLTTLHRRVESDEAF